MLAISKTHASPVSFYGLVDLYVDAAVVSFTSTAVTVNNRTPAHISSSPFARCQLEEIHLASSARVDANLFWRLFAQRTDDLQVGPSISKTAPTATHIWLC
jgi:hypothetical protein